MLSFHDGGLTLVPGFLVPIAALPFVYWVIRRKADRRWTLLALLAVVHVTLVIALTIFPIPVAGQDFYRRTRGMSEDNIVPFATISSQLMHLSLNNLRQLVGNMLALMPLGIYASGLWPALRDWRKFVLVAIAFGVGIELTQYAGSLIEGFTYRVTDVDDAIMNASGAVIAFLLWPIVRESALGARVAAEVEARYPEPGGKPT
jgi:glycopeptide antibiotics resistance protein